MRRRGGAAGDRADSGRSAPRRWTLHAIRATFPRLRGLTFSGVWHMLRRTGGYAPAASRSTASTRLRRQTSVTSYWPACATRPPTPDEVVLVSLDEMGFYRWPEAADWGTQAPCSRRGGSHNKQWRIIGALNALTGQATYRDAYIIGREKVSTFYHHLVTA